MAAAVVFHQFVQDLAHKVHNLGSDTLKLALTNSAPTTSNTVFGDITEIAAGNGYTAGGATITVTSSSQTAGVYKLIIQDVTITAGGGSIGPFRYAVLYNSTPTSPLKPLIQYYDCLLYTSSRRIRWPRPFRLPAGCSSDSPKRYARRARRQAR